MLRCWCYFGRFSRVMQIFFVLFRVHNSAGQTDQYDFILKAHVYISCIFWIIGIAQARNAHKHGILQRKRSTISYPRHCQPAVLRNKHSAHTPGCQERVAPAKTRRRFFPTHSYPQNIWICVSSSLFFCGFAHRHVRTNLDHWLLPLFPRCHRAQTLVPDPLQIFISAAPH